MHHTPQSVKAIVEAEVDRLFAPWLVGRPDSYVADKATKVIVSLGYWLREELTRVCSNEQDRRTQEWKFNRMSRTYDPWETAAECINEAIDGNVEQDRKPHRRWG